MLSKQDYLDYLKEMFDIETKMANVYSGLKEDVGDSHMNDLFRRLVDDETSHANAVCALTELIKQKYPDS
jgi:rubrerythrin